MIKKILTVAIIGLFICLSFPTDIGAAELKETNYSPLNSLDESPKGTVYGFIIGLQNNLSHENGYYCFEAVRIIIFPIGGFAISLHSNELIKVNEDGRGYIGKHFIIGMSYIEIPD